MARRRQASGFDGSTPLVPGYRDLELIAHGGFSVVYRAFQETFNRTVAVKIVDVDLTDPGAQAVFWSECATTGRLTGHPNIVTLLESGLTTDRRPYLTVDYYERGSLADRLFVQGPLPVEDVLRIGVKIAGALETAHSSGILHRDVKPQNILVSQFGEPALADFGIAAFDDESASRVIGALTPVHAAPEILAGQPASRASDVFSLGSTLYFLLAGSAAHEARPGEELVVLQRRIVLEPVRAIHRNDVSPETVAVLQRMLAPEPDARFQTALDAGLALRELQRGLGLARTDLVVPDSSQGPRPGQDELVELRPPREARPLPPINVQTPRSGEALPGAKRTLPVLSAAGERLEVNLGAPPRPVAVAVTTRGAGAPQAQAPTRPVANPVLETFIPDRLSSPRSRVWIAVASVAVAAIAIGALVFALSGGTSTRVGTGSDNADTLLPAEPGAGPSNVQAAWLGDSVVVKWNYNPRRDQATAVFLSKKDLKDRAARKAQKPDRGQAQVTFPPAELLVTQNTAVCAKVSITYKDKLGRDRGGIAIRCTA